MKQNTRRKFLKKYMGIASFAVVGGAFSNTHTLLASAEEGLKPLDNDVKNWFDIRDYGASCAKDTVNTKAIQAAIDDCNKAGGGTVYCPPGLFVTGTLWLKSNVNLHLEAGCILKGSQNRTDYEENLTFPESRAFTSERVSDAHLIIAYRAEKIAISGRGVIDGNSSAFMPFLAPEALKMNAPLSRQWKWRPGQMVFFCLCNGVQVEGVDLNNAPYWTLFLHGCNQVKIHGLSITNPDPTPNGDGIDVDCCRDVCINSCQISGGDDCITLRGNADPLGEAAQPCENVTVTNCVLHTRCNAIRVGVGGGVIRNCSFSNIVIRDSGLGINVISNYSGVKGRGVDIQHIRFADMLIDAHMPVYISTGESGSAPVSDIVLSDMTIRGGTVSFVGGMPDNPVSGVTFRNMDLTVSGGEENKPLPPDFSGNPEWTLRYMGAPYGICIAEAKAIRLQNVHVRWGELEGLWQHAIFARNSSGIALSHVDSASSPNCGEGDAAIHCVNCSEISLRSCGAEAGTKRFLSVSGSPEGAAVRLIGNDFTGAEAPVSCDAEILESGNLRRPT